MSAPDRIWIYDPTPQNEEEEMLMRMGIMEAVQEWTHEPEEDMLMIEYHRAPVCADLSQAENARLRKVADEAFDTAESMMVYLCKMLGLDYTIVSRMDVIQGVAELHQRIKTLEEALQEIAKGEGEFSLDPLTHASNTIDNMKAIAEEALAGGDE